MAAVMVTGAVGEGAMEAAAWGGAEAAVKGEIRAGARGEAKMALVTAGAWVATVVSGGGAVPGVATGLVRTRDPEKRRGQWPQRSL